MVTRNYIPDRGDLIWIDFNPQAGREQAGRRPALVISPLKYNKVTGLCILFPVTSKVKCYPFEVKITTMKITGVILSDHVKNLDWRIRHAEYIEKASAGVLEEVTGLFSTLIL